MASDAALVGALAQARALGFLGPSRVEAHIEHALAYLPLIDGAAGVAVDLGTGGGVPGLVLARHLPTWTWVLLDSSRRRTSFLTVAIVQLGLAATTSVVRARAEEFASEAAHKGAYDLVTARSFGPPRTTAKIASGLLRPGGTLLVAEPPAREEGRWPADLLGRFSLVDRGSTSSPAIRKLVRST